MTDSLFEMDKPAPDAAVQDFTVRKWQFLNRWIRPEVRDVVAAELDTLIAEAVKR